jgi:hypothetical protein
MLSLQYVYRCGSLGKEQENTRKVCKTKFVPKLFAFNWQRVLIFHVVYFRKACLSAVYNAECSGFVQYNQWKVSSFSLISQLNQSKIPNKFWPLIRKLLSMKKTKTKKSCATIPLNTVL